VKKENQKPKGSPWAKTQYANLWRYVPSGTFYARARVAGKLRVRSLDTNSLSVARLRLGDFIKAERQASEGQQSLKTGKMSFGAAREIYLSRLEGNPALKPRTKAYHREQLKALDRSWPGLGTILLRDLGKSDLLTWAARFGKEASASVFNHTLGILKAVIEIGVEAGARYDNPARNVPRVPVRPKKLVLPEREQFAELVAEIANGGSGFSKPCAELVQFLAFGGFRKGEAAFVAWADCDFKRGRISVRGHPEEGTKTVSSLREVPMIPDMRSLLLRLRESRSAEPATAYVMRVNECQKAIDRACKVRGIPRITHHDLRHLFATLCIESGVDVPTVSRWLGHKDGGALAMRVYGHLRDEHSGEMAQRVTIYANRGKT
jgi:integrase